MTPGNDIYNHPSSQIDHQYAVQAAAQHAGSQDTAIFQNAVNHINSGPPATPSLDHQEVEDAHTEAYGNGNAAALGASGMGAAAAMQAFKMFTSHGGSAASAAGGGGGNTQSQLLSMAMAEASKLFDQGGAASGNKQEAVTSAAKTMLKLLVQSKMGAGGAGGAGGGSSGSLSSLLSLANKFM